MQKELINRLLIILGAATLIFLVVFVTIKLNTKEEVKIVTNNNWSELNDNNEYKVDINALKKDKKNSDIYGVLRVDSVDLNVILTKTSDNLYYLNHNLKDKKSSQGNPFIDYRNKDIKDDVIIIYSKANNESMNKLSSLFNRDLFNKENLFYLYLGEDSAEYELIAVKMTYMNLSKEGLVSESYTEYNDSTDTLEEKKYKEDEKESLKDDEEDKELKEDKEDEKVEENVLYNTLIADYKYCKDDCSKDVEYNNLLVIELINENPNSSNLLLVAKRVDEE